MIIGLPGAGKSFFAGHFADTFGAPLISADRLRFELFEKHLFNQAEAGLIKRLTELQLTEIVKTRTSILVDGLCNGRKERQQFEQFAAAHKYGTLVVWVQTDELTAKNRSFSRNRKRLGDEYNVKLTAEQFKAFSAAFTPPTKQEDYVVISGKHTYTTQVKMVLRKLAAPHAQKASTAHKESIERDRTKPAARTSAPQGRRNVLIR